uniref:Xanthine dehydrogenase family protein subunit M n=3 Tax=Staphylothermus marinus TaxID=2280 RepID=A0A7J3PLZ9_STAMA
MFYKLPEFNYYKPSNLKELLELIDKLDDYKILAGGTDLLIDMRIKRYEPRNIVDINHVKELEYILVKENKLHIGALTRLQTLIDSKIIFEKTPLLHEAVSSMGSWQIRCLASIGGNLCNASPAADTAPPLLVYNAELVLSSRIGERVVSIHEFFKGPRQTVLNKNELLKEIIVPILENYGYSYIKIGRRNSFTLSIVSVATLLKIENNVFKDVRIALNSIAPIPIRAKSVEEYLINREVSDSVIEDASKRVLYDISPITDIRASADYRRRISIIVVQDSIREAVDYLKR